VTILKCFASSPQLIGVKRLLIIPLMCLFYRYLQNVSFFRDLLFNNKCFAFSQKRFAVFAIETEEEEDEFSK
jgi:hypothetical protein